MNTLFWRTVKGAVGVFTAFGFLFLIGPLFVIVPLSFNAEPYFTFRPEMLMLDPEAFSLRWYENLFNDEEWHRALFNSFFIGICATILATTLGTLAAISLNQSNFPARRTVMALLISPMVTPIVIVGCERLFLLFATVYWVGANLSWDHPLACHAGCAVRGDYGNRNTRWFQPNTHARCIQSRRERMDTISSRPTPTDLTRRDYRRTVRVRDLVR